MSTHGALIQRMMERYNAMDADGLTDLLHSEARHSAPGSDFGTDLVGRSKIVEYFQKNVFPSFQRVKFDVVFQWEDREKGVVVIEWRSHLWPKTGKNYSNTGAFVIEIRDDKVYWVREYFDTEKAHQNVSGG